MKRMDIDFAPRSLRRSIARTHRFTWLFSGIGLLLCMSAGVKAFHLLKQYQTTQGEMLRVQMELDKRAARKPFPKKLEIPEAQASAVNAAVVQLNLPWRDIFDAVESATPATIALLALEPDAKKHIVKGMAEAKNSDGMIAYIEQLKRQEFFTEVVLIRHEVNEQDPNKPLRFQFEAQWTEAMQ